MRTALVGVLLLLCSGCCIPSCGSDTPPPAPPKTSSAITDVPVRLEDVTSEFEPLLRVARQQPEGRAGNRLVLRIITLVKKTEAAGATGELRRLAAGGATGRSSSAP